MIHFQPVQRGFQCPLRRRCLTAAASPFESADAANRAVVRYQRITSAPARRHRAQALYRRHLPLVAGTLRRFCAPSQCYPGGCRVEELVGETYPLFVQVMEAYDPTVGTDFLGFASQRLRWGLEHRARKLERELFRAPPPEASEPVARKTPEDALIDRLYVQGLIAELDDEDAELLSRYAEGLSTRELAAVRGISDAALRKRLQRLRDRLRAIDRAGTKPPPPR